MELRNEALSPQVGVLSPDGKFLCAVRQKTNKVECFYQKSQWAKVAAGL
jgi:hypothetical protein